MLRREKFPGKKISTAKKSSPFQRGTITNYQEESNNVTAAFAAHNDDDFIVPDIVNDSQSSIIKSEKE